MKRNTEIKVKVVDCNPTTHLVVLQTGKETFCINSKEFYDFIATATPVKKASITKKDSLFNDSALMVLQYLNKQSDRNFDMTEKNLEFIIARLKDGDLPETLLKVIDVKSWEWKNDYKMKKYLRPETLFNPTKFTSYKQQILDIEKNPTLFKDHVIKTENEKRTSTYDPFSAMPD